mmetsp:Transcript_5178/g.15076  ORF Transcript_5178/g.15076 Transcript_5178/m.15076 type:complete len:475 (-) Transcript_5178:145-1569(-)
MIEANYHSVPPENDLDVEFVSELNKLSMKERDEANYDVHGVSDILNEVPDFVAASIKSFGAALDRIPENEKKAYLLAMDQNSDYVRNDKFVLMFLRALQFDAKAAAARFVSFFQMKLQLFGQEKLARDIRVDDLDEQDITCLESGYAQVLSARDRADRAIFMLMPMIPQFRSEQNRLRTIFLVLMFALNDVQTQKRGIVAIPYNIGYMSQTQQGDRTVVLNNTKLVISLPLRLTAVHYCYNDEKLRSLFFYAMYVFEKAARIRARFHCGTDMEVIYTLMTFGIPSEFLPVTANGTLRLDAHREYVRKMRKISQANGDIERTIVPGKYDVLLGRGKPLQKYSGNLNYHYVIECYHDRYEAAAKGDKAVLAMEIVKKIHSQGGRFLKQDDAGWTIISDDAAKSKVSHTFRNHRIAARTAYRKAIERMKAHRNTTGGDTESCPSNKSAFEAKDSIRSVSPNLVEQKKMRVKDLSTTK